VCWGLVCLTVPLLSHAGKLYKWVDQDGNVTYQDQQPPGEATVIQDDTTTTASPASGTAADTAQQNAVEANPVTLFSVPICSTCDLVRMVLEQNKVPFEEKNADRSVEVQQEMEAKAGQLTVPILIIGEEVLPGFNGPAILQALKTAGYSLVQRPGTQQTAGAGEEESDVEQPELESGNAPESEVSGTQSTNY
jgi:glutaredoxin-like protein NrdH